MKLSTCLSKLLILLLVAVLSVPAFAYSTNEERIDAYLHILATSGDKAKQKMLQQLQWSGLSDARLFDDIERRLLSKYNEGDFDRADIELMNYEVRALGYSGNAAYRETLQTIKNNKKAGKLRNHAKKALLNLDDFIVWNQLVADSDFTVENKTAEITTYMKMLATDNVFVQRLAARAVYHERVRDGDVLALIASKLKGLYKRDNLSKDGQDAAAWLCKAIGESGVDEYLQLLAKVTAETPYPKIRKYSSKY